MSTKRKVKKIVRGDKTIAFKVNKNDLEEDFEGYWKNMCKALGAESLKIKDHDESTVIAYDRNKTYYG